MGFIGDVLAELKSAVQLAGRIDEKVGALTHRVAANETVIKDMLGEMHDQGQRIARLEKGEETLEERTKLYLEKALLENQVSTEGTPSHPQLGHDSV